MRRCAICRPPRAREGRLQKSTACHLDSDLLDVLQGKANIDTLVPADNAGLGIARAVAVVRALKADGRLNAYSILPLSGAQLIDRDDKVTSGGGGADKQRRRIEIRVRRSHPRGAHERPSTAAAR